MANDTLHTGRIMNLLTVGAAFLMGYIDAYTFLELNHVFVSAQTGNMVTYGIKLVNGESSAGFANVMSFFGFLIGAFAGEVFLAKLKISGRRRYRLFLYIQAVLLLFLAIFHLRLSYSMIVLILGILSGYALTTFRVFASTPVNVGIMTGNARTLMHDLYMIIFKKDEQAKKEMLHLFTVIFSFIIGVGAAAAIINWQPDAVLWIAFGFVTLPLGALYITIGIHNTDT